MLKPLAVLVAMADQSALKLAVVPVALPGQPQEAMGQLVLAVRLLAVVVVAAVAVLTILLTKMQAQAVTVEFLVAEEGEGAQQLLQQVAQEEPGVVVLGALATSLPTFRQELS